MEVQLDNSILIFDEAHNIESVAEECSSLELSENHLTQGIKELATLEKSTI